MYSLSIFVQIVTKYGSTSFKLDFLANFSQGLNTSWKPWIFSVLFQGLESPWILIDEHFQTTKKQNKIGFEEMKVRHGWLVIQKAEVWDGCQCLCIIKMVGLKNKSPLLFGTFSWFIWNLCNKLRPCNLKIWSLIVLEFGGRRSVWALFSGGNGLKTVKHRRELNANVVCFFVDFIFFFHSR